jgi:hypothetical protein
MIGEVTTTAYFADGTSEVIEAGNNLVVSSAYKLLAGLLKGHWTTPKLFWAIGDGGAGAVTATWDAQVIAGTNPPTSGQTALLREVFRKEIVAGDIAFLTSGGAVSATPTNILQIKVTFEETEPNVPSTFLREWGIFGGDASAAANSGLMLNRKVHVTYEKTNAVKIERVLKLTL